MQQITNAILKALINLCVQLDTPIQVLKETHATPKIIELNKQYWIFVTYVKGVLGISCEDPKKAEKLWIDAKIANRSTEPLDKIFKLPAWINLLSYLPRHMPNNLISIITQFNEWKPIPKREATLFSSIFKPANIVVNNSSITEQKIEACIAEFENLKTVCRGILAISSLNQELKELFLPSLTQ